MLKLAGDMAFVSYVLMRLVVNINSAVCVGRPESALAITISEAAVAGLAIYGFVYAFQIYFLPKKSRY